jgi:hypothetical protein
MLIAAEFFSKGKTQTRVFNPENIVYMDDAGVLLAVGIHAMWSADEYHRVVTLLEQEGILI